MVTILPAGCAAGRGGILNPRWHSVIERLFDAAAAGAQLVAPPPPLPTVGACMHPTKRCGLVV